MLKNSYICSADNYFTENPFAQEVENSYYAAQYADGYTAEWCMTEDEYGYINSVTIGGEKSWYMIGHAFWAEAFSRQFLLHLRDEYDLPETANKLWETIFVEHLDSLKMKIKKYASHMIHEFDTLDELREFDVSYLTDTKSQLINKVAKQLNVSEDRIVHITPMKSDNTDAVGFQFDCGTEHYSYQYATGKLEKA